VGDGEVGCDVSKPEIYVYTYPPNKLTSVSHSRGNFRPPEAWFKSNTAAFREVAHLLDVPCHEYADCDDERGVIVRHGIEIGYQP
jgi:hypothetical protein